VAPTIYDEITGTYNAPFLDGRLELVQGWRRMQGIVFRLGRCAFRGLNNAQDAVHAALADPSCRHGQPQSGRGHAV